MYTFEVSNDSKYKLYISFTAVYFKDGMINIYEDIHLACFLYFYISYYVEGVK